MDSDKHYDRRTTPKHLQVPYVLGLYVLAIFFMGCFHFSMAEKRPRWSYWGAFHVFTTKSTNNYQLDGEAYVNGRRESLSLEEMYPTRWESGHRYQRGPFRRSKIRMRTLAASTCHRDARDPKAVRFIQKRWKRRLGTTDQSIRDPEVKVLLSWDCQTPWPLPGGRSLPLSEGQSL